MSTLPEHRPDPSRRPGPNAVLPPSMTLPPIRRLPPGYRSRPTGDRGPDALGDLLDGGTRRWSGEPVALSPEATRGLWLLLLGDLAFGGWLGAVRAGAAPCAGFPCTVVTLGGHPDLLLVVTAGCVTALAGTAAMSRGLTSANAAQLGVIGVGAVGGAAALLGVVALFLVVAMGTVAVGVALLMIVDRS